MAFDRAAETRARRRQKYSSPLRERQKAFTHDLVMRSVVELIAEGKILSFTVQDVAARAGVSYAAVYRHFPTRNSLLEEVNDWAEEAVRPRAPPDPTTIDDLALWPEGVYPILEENAALIRAVAMASAVLGFRARGSVRRDRVVRELVRDASPNMSEEDRMRASAVIRFLLSSQAWIEMTQRFGLDNKGAAVAIAWGVRTLIQDVKIRNARSSSRPAGKRRGASR